jgi:hypothetical protein
MKSYDVKEIYNALEDSLYHPKKLDEIVDSINNTRKKQNEQTLGRTTIYDGVKELSENQKILWEEGYGYYLKVSNYKPSDIEIYNWFYSFKKCINQVLCEKDDIIFSVPENVKDETKKSLKDRLRDLWERNVITIIENNEVILDFIFAKCLHFCPICLESIKENEPVLSFLMYNEDEEVKYYTIETHIQCGREFRNRDKYKNLKLRDLNAKSNWFSKKIEKKEIEADLFEIKETCAECGLPVYLDEIISDLKKSGIDKDDSKYLEIFKELYSDILMLYWISQIDNWYLELYDTNYSFDVAKIIKEGTNIFHPNCYQKHKNMNIGGDN